MTNILMLRKFSEQKIQYLEDKYGVKIHLMEEGRFPEGSLLDEIEIYAGWRIGSSIELMPQLKWIQLYSVGVDRYIDKLSSMENPPRITNNRGAYGIPLGEHSMALLFAVNRRIGQYVRNQIERNWRYQGSIKEVAGSTAGIVGFGDVGKYTAKMLHALGAKVLVQKLNETAKPEYVDEIYYGNEGLDAMLPKCDFVLISLPGTEDTRHLFDKQRMLKIKQGAVITNVGRGYVIDCDALAELIELGHITGAGLDVTDPEPLPKDHKLWGMDNVIITPHMAGSSPNFSERLFEVFEENLKSYLAGERMPNEIDFNKGY